MGLYDSFLLELPEETIECQVKEFNCTLDSWCLGDTIDLPSPLYKETFYLVQPIYYTQNDKYKDKWATIFVYRKTFLNFVISDSEEIANEVGKNFLQFDGDNKDCMISLLSDYLKKKNKKFFKEVWKRLEALSLMYDVNRFLDGNEASIFNEKKWSNWGDRPSMDAPREEKLEYIIKKIANNINLYYPQYTGQVAEDIQIGGMFN